MTRTPSLTDTYRSLTGRLDTTLGVAIVYYVTGIVEWTLASGASPAILLETLTDPIAVLWPLFLYSPQFWMYTAVGLFAGLSVLSVLEHTRLPVATPNAVPTVDLRHSVTLATAFVLAEVVARYTATAAFVLHLHVWPPYRGEPGDSFGETVALYQDALAFFADYDAQMSYLVYVGRILPEIGSVPSGGPEIGLVLRRVGEIQFFEGVGFAILVGYLVALGLSYGVVRVVSSRVWDRFERYRAAE